MEQHHYFLNTEHRKEDYFSFTDYFMGDSYTFESCADIFSCKNANNIGVKVDVFDSNLYDNVNFKVNHIVTNPPIKAGKQNLFNVVIGAKDVLEPNGTITLVIKKKHGMESLKNKMNEIFGNVKILNRDKGYYILHSEKIN